MGTVAMNPLKKVLNSIETNVGNIGFSSMNQGGNIIAGMFDSVGAQVAKGFESLAGDAARNAKSVVYKTNNAMKREVNLNKYTSRLSNERAMNLANSGFSTSQIFADKQIHNLSMQKHLSFKNYEKNKALRNNAQSTIDLYNTTSEFLTDNQRLVGGVAVGAGALGATGLGVAAYNAYND